MLRNWSKIALASFLVLMIGAPIANATTARVRSLANTGDYISDDSAVNRWYSTLSSFSNQVNAEMGTWDGFSLADTRGLGWIHACGEDGKWGTYRISLNENAVDHPGFWIGNPFYTVHVPGAADNLGDPFGFGTWADTPMNRWDLAGAWEVGEAIALGLSVTESKWHAEDTDNDAQASNSFFTVGAGVTWTNNENMVLDGSLTYGSAGGDVTSGTNSVEWDSKTAIDFAARLFYDWKENVTLVPVVEYATSEYSLSASPAAIAIAPPNGDKITDFMIALGLNMDVNQDNMLVFALEYMNRTWEYANADTVAADVGKTTWNYFPTIRLALESHITSWLTTRVGAAKYIGSVKDETNGGDEFKESPGVPTGIPGVEGLPGFDWFLGCGFNVAEWTIDLELAEETPFNLGYWLTGYSNYETGAGPVARISGVYNY
jgi:hypothetical protein